MKIDFTRGTLANRSLGEAALVSLQQRLRDSEDDGLLILDFGDNIATLSWLDSVVCTLCREGERALVVVSQSDDMREHLETLLGKRRLAIYLVLDFVELQAGSLIAIGHVSEAQLHCLEVIRRFGDAFVAEVASALNVSIEATQLRLNELLALNLLRREKEGKAYLYRLPSASLEPTASVA